MLQSTDLKEVTIKVSSQVFSITKYHYNHMKLIL